MQPAAACTPGLASRAPQVEGAAVLKASVSLRPGARVARVELAPAPATYTHAMLALTADGSREAARRVTLRCGAPCGFEPTPFRGRAAEMHNIRLGAPHGATLSLQLTD